MTPAEMVGSLRRRGILLVPAGDGRLRYRPRESLSETERVVLARHRAAILALFDADPIGWRAAVMAAQVARTGPMSLVIARPGIRFKRGTCCSCGDLLACDDRYRCSPCTEAVIAALGELG
jgi:hypothetical protein